MRWGMVIDLRKCMGCRACSVSCQEINQVPGGHLRRVHDCGLSAPPRRQRLFLPTSCMHCRSAPCAEVCPTEATHHLPDGTVDVDRGRCIGCGYCIAACPYRARHIYAGGTDLIEHGGTDEVLESDLGDIAGICVKCSFCHDRVTDGLAKGLVPGVDAEASPACVMTCSAKALYFGNLDDPESEVSRLLRENRTTCLKERLGTEPRVYYILPLSWSWSDDAGEVLDK